MAIDLCFYRERYNMDEDYYTGDRDIYCRLNFRTLHELKQAWGRLFKASNHWLEGETYSAWYSEGGTHNALLCGGAFDPSDMEYIEDAFDRVPFKDTTYRIRPEYIDNWGPDATADTVITGKELDMYARGWDMSRWELIEQLIEEE